MPKTKSQTPAEVHIPEAKPKPATQPATTASEPTAVRQTPAVEAKPPAQPTAPRHQNATVPEPAPSTLDLIADAVAEMLTKGTTTACLDKLLVAAIEHIARRTWRMGREDRDEKGLLEAMDRDLKHFHQPWKEDVMVEWRRARRKAPTAVEPTTVSEIIRANYRGQLESYFGHFMAAASPEEIRFLREVFIDRDQLSCCPALTAACHELDLGEAFALQIEREEVYFRVPTHLSDQMRAYLSALIAVDGKAA